MIRKLQALGESDDYFSWYYITPERILEMVELLGMLPPPKELINNSRIEDRLGRIVKAEYFEEGLWENEDDK